METKPLMLSPEAHLLFLKSFIFFAPLFEIREEVRKEEKGGKT